MKITEKNLDVGLELALNDLKKNLGELGGAGEKVSRVELLAKARVAFREGKISLLESGNLEGRLNKGLTLKPEHRAVLGLTDSSKIEGLESPQQSGVASRMGGEKTPGAQISTTGSPVPKNPVIEEMARGQTLLHNFQQSNNEIMTVTGAEILLKCRELVKKGTMTLLEAGDVERAVNSGATIRPEILREIFA